MYLGTFIFRSGGNEMIINVMERIVDEIYEEVLKTHEIFFCDCQKCRDDVKAIVLNEIQPKYVSTDKGEAISKAEFQEVQFRIDVLDKIVKAIIKVGNNPQHKKEEH